MEKRITHRMHLLDRESLRSRLLMLLSNCYTTLRMLNVLQDGPEVDVDLVFSEGQPVYGCLTDNWPTVEPYFNETGSNCPSILPMDQQKALIDLAVHSTQALGFSQVQVIETCEARGIACLSKKLGTVDVTYLSKRSGPAINCMCCFLSCSYRWLLCQRSEASSLR